MKAAGFTPPRSDVARRTDGSTYQTMHPQFVGKGVTRSCSCGKHHPFTAGWKRTRLGLTAPQCLNK